MKWFAYLLLGVGLLGCAMLLILQIIGYRYQDYDIEDAASIIGTAGISLTLLSVFLLNIPIG